jgi:hypothetical protein
VVSHWLLALTMTVQGGDFTSASAQDFGGTVHQRHRRCSFSHMQCLGSVDEADLLRHALDGLGLRANREVCKDGPGAQPNRATHAHVVVH